MFVVSGLHLLRVLSREERAAEISHTYPSVRPDKGQKPTTGVRGQGSGSPGNLRRRESKIGCELNFILTVITSTTHSLAATDKRRIYQLDRGMDPSEM